MPINRKIGVNLAFTADTKQAQAQLNNLQNTLTQLVNTAPTQGFSGFTKELQQASAAAATLKVQLSDATNVNTGKLDLGKFNQSLKTSGMTLEMYKNQLANLGPQGVAAFGQLSQAIMNAEMPLRRSSQLLTDFATTLKNTARWQISSSILHGFMGSVQSAYYYAQDLNESLNNIRIVTGKSVDEMADFAKEANSAAQALSTTTTAYTDASLIYYQQGLSDEEVKERTDVTIKMANVARESATEVSEQMTAIWNNFAKGGENLEYYSDVITALGAATASSSAEIAEGLEKFAAVADTVGLSYEYATSALATVTATTRQSADIVGNAFKTLFSRIQGLKLGETLDDGTDLNKYSAALEAVGVNIKGVDGELKDMDVILDELGNKWQTLGKDQKMALAQTVAGVRQYTQLIALMDNWDFFQENLSTARNSEGTLQEQANIYAESWEAAQKRVKAAAEQIYDDLLNDQFFISINDALTKFLNLIDKLIKSIGGLSGVLSIVGAGLLKIFGTQLAEGINNTIYTFKRMAQIGSDSLQQTKNEVNELLQSFYQETNNPFDRTIGEAYKLQGQAQDELIKQANQLDESQKKIAATLLDQHNILVQNTVEQAKQTKEISNQLQQSKNNFLRNKVAHINANDAIDARENLDKMISEYSKAGRFSSLQSNLFGDFSEFSEITTQSANTIKGNITAIIEKFGVLGGSLDENKVKLQETFGEIGGNALANFYQTLKSIDTNNLSPENIEKIKQALIALSDAEQEASVNISNLGQTARENVEILTEDAEAVERLGNESLALGQAQGELDASLLRTSQNAETFGERLRKLVSSLELTGTQVVKLAQSFASASMMAGTISNSITSLSNGTLSVTQAFTSLGIVIPQVVNAITKMSAATGIMNKMLEGGFLLVLTAAITTIQLVAEHIKKLRQEMIETSKISVEAAEKIREEVEANEEIYNSYAELYEEYQKGIIAKEDLYDATDQLVNAYELEGGAIAKLTGNYDALTKAANEAREAELREAKEANERVLKERPQGGFAEGSEGRGHFTNNRKTYVFNADYGYAHGDEWQARDTLIETATSYDIDRSGNAFQIDTSNATSFINYYKALSETLSKLADQGLTHTDTYKNISEELGQIEGAYNDIVAAQKGILEESLELSATNNDIENATKDNIGQIINNIKRDIEKEIEAGNISSDTDVDKAVTTYVASLNNEIANAFLQNKTLKESGLSDNVLDYFNNNFTNKEQELILTSGITFDEYTTEQELNTVLANVKNKIGSVSIPLDMSASINETVLKGKDINKGDWESLLSTIPDSAKDILGDRDEFNNKGIAERLNLLNQVNELIIENSNLVVLNTEKQREANKLRNEEIEKELQALQKQRDALTENKFALSKDPFDQQAFEASLQEIDDKINHFLEEQRTLEITPEISLDAANDALNATAEVMLNDLNKMKAGVELIGENWTVAADDVRQFAAYFPELAAQAEHLADGSLKFTQETIAATLNGNVQIMNSNKEVIVQAIDDKLIQLRAENEFQKKKIAILKEVLKGTKSEADAEIEIAGAAREYKDTLEEHGVQVDSEAWDAAMKNAEVGTGNIISQLEAVNQAIGVVHDNFAKMLTKDGLSNFDVSGVSAGMTGNNDWSADVDESEYAKNLAESTIKAFTLEIEAAQQVVESNNEQIASLEGTRAEILKTLKDSSDAVDRVNKGLAGKESKDKKSGGSSKKDKERDKEQKKLEDEFDRYWELKKAIDAVDKAISKLEKDQQNLYGYELINSLKEENKLLEQQKGHYEALAEAQRQEAAELQGVLAGYGVAFDASGAITNYAAATSAALAQYNDAIAQYNAGLIEESALKVYEKNYEAFKKALERYDTLFYNEMKDTQDKLDDLWRKELANNLKAWEVEVKLKLDMKELKRGWNDFLKEINEDFKKVYKDVNVDLKNLKKNAKTYVSGDGTINTIIKAIHDVTGEIDKLRSGGASDMFESISQAQEKLKELNEQLQDAARGLNDLRKEAYELYMSQIEQIGDMFDAIRSDFEAAKDEIEFVQQAYELILGEKAYDKKDEIYKAQEAANSNEVQALRREYEFYKGQLDELGTLEKDRTEWTKDELEFYNKMMDAQTNLNDAILEGMELFKKDYLNTVEKIRDTLDKDITGGKGLEYARESWERAREAADLYLDDVQKLTEAQSLTNKVEGLMSSTTDTAAQAKLQKFLDKEVQALKEKEKVSKYEVEAAQAKLDIVEKEIALRDAQENKTSMKLTRNEQGNWTYQYIADEDDVNAKQQDMLESLTKLRELALSTNTDLEELIFKTQETYENAVAQLVELLNTGAITQEEYNARYEEIENQHAIKMNYIQEQMAIVRNDAANASAALLWGLYEQDPENYQAMTTEEQGLIDGLRDAGVADFLDLEEKTKENFQGIGDKSQEVMNKVRVDDWHTTAQDILNEWTKDNGDSVKAKMKEAITAIGNAHDEMIKNMKNKLTEGGKSYDKLTEDINDAVKMTDKLRDETDDYANKSEPRLDESRRLIEAIENAWSKVKGPIEDAIHTIEEYLQYVGDTKIAMDELTMSAANAANAIAAAKAAEAAGGGGTTGGPGEKTPGEPAHYIVTTGSGGQGDQLYEGSSAADAQNWINRQKEKDPGFIGHLWSYDTGGYTGNWGNSDGHLAMLHQKELVLNKNDTSNFLEGINTIRDMSSLNGSISKAIVSSVANMVLALSKHDINVPTGASSESVSVGDVFNITAEFPNANDVNEIRQAILSLPNLASQYMAQNGR